MRPDGAYVLYWMVAFRRPRWNFALQRAVEHARTLDRPLVVLEALRPSVKPERPVFGTVRFMSPENTARTVRVTRYIASHAP